MPRSFLAVLLLLLPLQTLAPATARAESQAEAPPGTPWFDTYSRIMFSLNQAVYGALERKADPGNNEAAAAPPPAWLTGVGNMAANLVNEPMSVVSALVAGEPQAAAAAAGRFAVNSTVGLLGWYDVARGWGLEPYHTDLGLALCAHGVGEGPYLVLPFIGPRTLRDGITDVVVTNVLLYSMFAPLLPANSGWQTIVMVESIEIVADMAATRQIDTRAKALAFDDYDAMRDRYLTQRRARCAALTGQSSEPSPAPPSGPVAAAR
ncbi:vacJ-like lipoprotein [Azospirillum sp. RWY-5-1]|uniref:VacJ-like lipoprotein n=1 Tax=Azospirillum oleiclasticum TaxID=2735135 RepID=A0ABX2TCW2_9PROT|nr:vacJ-like lipoprotein [Azospirillum oleiclasticum]NYZ22014.1 vacJ-like lipoprotein [Azospirillum oleiclasticum]